MRKIVENYLIYFVTVQFDMDDEVVVQALLMLDRCWNLKMNKFKLATVCSSLAFKFHQAEDTSGMYLRPGYKNKYGHFKNLAATELAIMKFLNYQMTF